jgi:glucokinase
MASDNLYVGVDLGGTKILAGVVDAAGKVHACAKKKTRAEEGVDAVVGRICACVGEALADIDAKRVAAVGVGVAGPTDFERGVVLTAGNMPWKNVPLAKMLRDKLNVPAVVVDNDVNAATYGEWLFGAGKGADDLLGVFVGTGIGAGLILNRRLYRGHSHTAGEIGHTVINAGGGLTGRTLEDLASRGALGVMLGRRIATNHPSMLSDMIEPDAIFTALRSGVLADAYAKGDDETVRCVHEAARYVGIAVANAVVMLSLPCVVIGGGLTEALGKAFVSRVVEHMQAELFPPNLKVKVAPAGLGDDAGCVGAAALAREAVES